MLLRDLCDFPKTFKIANLFQLDFYNLLDVFRENRDIFLKKAALQFQLDFYNLFGMFRENRDIFLKSAVLQLINILTCITSPNYQVL